MLICVTHRKLCHDDFLERIECIAKGKPNAIMLREKDLSLADYESLATKIKEICDEYQVPLIVNQNVTAAINLKLPNIQLSMTNLKKYHNELKAFERIGASVHSVSEAQEAQRFGVDYLIAGHIYSTESKKGVPPRGLPFLREICASVSIPVFAIGGITADKIKEVSSTGAIGVCIMSEAMTHHSPEELPKLYKVSNK